MATMFATMMDVAQAPGAPGGNDPNKPNGNNKGPAGHNEAPKFQPKRKRGGGGGDEKVSAEDDEAKAKRLKKNAGSLLSAKKGHIGTIAVRDKFNACLPNHLRLKNGQAEAYGVASGQAAEKELLRNGMQHIHEMHYRYNAERAARTALMSSLAQADDLIDSLLAALNNRGQNQGTDAEGEGGDGGNNSAN